MVHHINTRGALTNAKLGEISVLNAKETILKKINVLLYFHVLINTGDIFPPQKKDISYLKKIFLSIKLLPNTLGCAEKFSAKEEKDFFFFLKGLKKLEK